jgi:hypothetical protein
MLGWIVFFALMTLLAATLLRVRTGGPSIADFTMGGFYPGHGAPYGYTYESRLRLPLRLCLR